MKTISWACETYTWQMPGENYKGRLDHIMGIMRQAGFTGIEAETSFFGPLADPVLMQEMLDKHQLELTALCHVEDWRHPQETDAEKANTDSWIKFLTHFPDTMYLLVQMPGKNRNQLRERQANLLNCVNQIAQRATDKGIICSYHPNSPQGSIFRTASDYEILLNGLNPKTIGYTPDLGHIAKGGMDPLDTIKKYRETINLVHYKDMFANGKWAQTGEGIIDLEDITTYLRSSEYTGWIVMEDECDRAILDPDGVTLDDGRYLTQLLNNLD
jgi:inosose dehydratase